MRDMVRGLDGYATFNVFRTRPFTDERGLYLNSLEFGVAKGLWGG